MKWLFLILPCVAALSVPVYNTIEPKLWGIPAFFWIQLLLVPLSAVFILLAHLGAKK